MFDDQRPSSEGEARPHPSDGRPAVRERDVLDLGRAKPARDAGAAQETARKPGTEDAADDAEAQDGQSDDAAEDADDREDDARRPNVLRRHPFAFLLGGLAVVALCVGVFFYWLLYMHPYESTDDAFVDARSIAVQPKVGGYLVDVPVTDNQHVEAGQILFQIFQRDYQIALDQAKAQIEADEAGIKNIDAQIQAQYANIDVSKAQVATAEAALKFAQEDAARYKDLAERGSGSIQQSQSATSTLQQRQASLQSAQASVVAAQKQIGALQAQKASTQAQLARDRAQVEQAELNLGYTTVRAVQAGRVVRLTGGIGQLAQAGQSLAMFVPDDIWVTANFKETQITDMRPDQPVDIEIDAYPGRKIQGTVASVQPGSGTAFSLLPAQNATGNYVKVTQRIPVKIVVKNWPTDVSIGPGMSIVPTVTVR
ncbi:membrane fusion protein (multidrug efflux system) [Methylobacterium fujisawaense]|uniref:Membrane fusion protein (Multidrug efflux system) n=1 Tax=Methylobacterium fujisawaense TaxID=107400 RepID=A0ABR6DG93_9HYPH|nr:HlyD family secretion protein [Methylobacterium fujisawaense]MBA9065130.1 membrane fusion protein (multidrug efflux system) [Methylobacterium fujisawaense]